jgi:hypothetical protein
MITRDGHITYVLQSNFGATFFLASWDLFWMNYLTDTP